MSGAAGGGWRRRLVRAGEIAGALLAAGASLVAIILYFGEDHVVARFAGEPVTLESARALAAFLKENDGRIVRLDIGCGTLDADGNWGGYLDDSARCFADLEDSGAARFVLVNGPSAARHYWLESTGDAEDEHTVWFWVTIPENTSAEMFNGPKGAGWMQIKGDFAVTSFKAGTAPPTSTDYKLRAVAPEFAHN